MIRSRLFESAAKPGDTQLDPSLVIDLNHLIGPNSMEVEDQVGVLSDMWQALGRDMPQPYEGQLNNIDWHRTDGWTERKVIIFPFDESFAASQKGLQSLAENAQALAPQSFVSKGVKPLLTPERVREPGGWKPETSPVGHGPHAQAKALYKTPNGLVNRSDFLTAMAEDGKVIVAEDGSTWMYALMDLSPLRSGVVAGTEVRDLHAEVDYTSVPEALVAMHLAHKLAGAEGQPLTADVANEVIAVNPRGHLEDQSITTVGLDRNTGRISISYDHLHASSPHGGYGIRAGGGNRAPFEQAA